MGKKVLVSLVVFSLVLIGGGTVLQSMGGEPSKGKSEVSKKTNDETIKVVSQKPKIKFADVDASKLKVAKIERLTYDAQKTEYKSYMYPKWSPDGKMIAFTNASGIKGTEITEKSKGLWVMNADGSNKRKLTDEEGIGYNFEWSPDSKSIVYNPGNIVKEIEETVKGYKITYKRYYNVYIVGNTIKEIEVETKKNYKIISAKKSISPMIKDPSGEIISVIDDELIHITKDKDTKKLKAKSIQTSPGQGKIIYTSEKGIWIADANGENKRILGEEINKGIWSPDHKRIACLKYRFYYIIDIDENKKWSPKGFPMFRYGGSWSPDGSKIVLAEIKTEEQTKENSCLKSIWGGVIEADLYIGDMKGGYNLTNTKDEAELSPDWSPDGSSIVYVSGKMGDIYIITLGVE